MLEARNIDDWKNVEICAHKTARDDGVCSYDGFDLASVIPHHP